MDVAAAPTPHFYCRAVGRPNFNTVLGLPANSLLSSPLQMLVLFLLGLFQWNWARKTGKKECVFRVHFRVYFWGFISVLVYVYMCICMCIAVCM